MGHTLGHGELLRGISEGEGMGKKRRRGRPRLEYLGIWDARDLERSKSWHGTEPSGDRWLCQTSLRTMYSMLMN